jgi:hypothetical protein
VKSWLVISVNNYESLLEDNNFKLSIYISFFISLFQYLGFSLLRVSDVSLVTLQFKAQYRDLQWQIEIREHSIGGVRKRL